MEYSSIADAKQEQGLRLSLTAGLPAPWSEAAKALFRFKGIPFTAVAQQVGDANEELVAWTGQRNAPTAMYAEEPPRVTWLDMLNLAERLAPEPGLVPGDMEQRITMTGLLNELAGEDGMLWNGRHLMFHGMIQALGEDAMKDNPMIREYRYSEEAAARASQRVIDILQRLSSQLEQQAKTGSRYFIGESVTALDLYWACFSQVLKPLPPEVNPMPSGVRKAWEGVAVTLQADGYSVDPLLLQHRDLVFQEVIGLPLDF